MNIIKHIELIDEEGELYDPWHQIFLTRNLTDCELKAIVAIDDGAGIDGSADEGWWLNVGLDKRVTEYLNTLDGTPPLTVLTPKTRAALRRPMPNAGIDGTTALAILLMFVICFGAVVLYFKVEVQPLLEEIKHKAEIRADQAR